MICLDKGANRSRKTERKNSQEELEISVSETLISERPIHCPSPGCRVQKWRPQELWAFKTPEFSSWGDVRQVIQRTAGLQTITKGWSAQDEVLCNTFESHSQHSQGKEESPWAAPAAKSHFPKANWRELHKIAERNQKGSSSSYSLCASTCKCISDQCPVHTCFTLYPALALVSIYIIFSSRAFLSPSSIETCLQQWEQITEKKNQNKEK